MGKLSRATLAAGGAPVVVLGHGQPDKARLLGGSIDKLELYRGLGIGEVWFDDRLHGYALQENGYAAIETSRALPAAHKDFKAGA